MNRLSDFPPSVYVTVKDCLHCLLDWSDKEKIRRAFFEEKPLPKKDVNVIIKRRYDNEE